MDVQAAMLNKVELAKMLKPRIEAQGGDWAQAAQRLQELYPNGAAENELEEVLARITYAPKLRLLTGTHG